jgi:hypothetical protein
MYLFGSMTLFSMAALAQYYKKSYLNLNVSKQLSHVVVSKCTIFVINLYTKQSPKLKLLPVILDKFW